MTQIREKIKNREAHLDLSNSYKKNCVSEIRDSQCKSYLKSNQSLVIEKPSDIYQFSLFF